MHKLSLLFRDEIILKGLWPTGLLDSSPLDFLYGATEDSAYDSNPCNMDGQKTSISDITANISLLLLQTVYKHADVHFQNFL